MSVINKKPFIKDVLESLSAEDASELMNLMDGGAGDSLSRTPLTIDAEDDLGVHRCQMALKEGLYTGYLVIGDKQVMIYYADKQALGMIEFEDGDYRFIEEPLDIDELRSELGIAGHVVVSKITEMNTHVLEALKCGDIIVKTDSTGGHAYLVTFKKDKVGICLTYLDASTVETVSYDWDADENKYIYNGTDKATLS